MKLKDSIEYSQQPFTYLADSNTKIPRTYQEAVKLIIILCITIYYVCETERGMMAADSELTKQLSSHTLLKNSIKFK